MLSTVGPPVQPLQRQIAVNRNRWSKDPGGYRQVTIGNRRRRELSEQLARETIRSGKLTRENSRRKSNIARRLHTAAAQIVQRAGQEQRSRSRNRAAHVEP